MNVFFCSEMCVELQDAIDWSTPSLDIACRFRDAIELFNVPVNWRRPTPLSIADWQAVHAPGYVADVLAGSPTVYEAANLLASRRAMEAIQYAAGSLVQATLSVLNADESGCALSPTSSWHHAHYDRPGVFCVLNALALAAVKALEVDGVEQVLIVDGDYHFGNGTEDILGRLSTDQIHHISLGRWFTKPSQSRDYLRKVEEIAASIHTRKYDVVIYQAGMDVLTGDPAGSLLTFEQARHRDVILFQACNDSETPVVWNFAGGYQKLDSHGQDPVIRGHLNTLLVAMDIFEGNGKFAHLTYK